MRPTALRVAEALGVVETRVCKLAGKSRKGTVRSTLVDVDAS